MKNLNLIKGLWDDSHEKQKMGGMRRYAAMLMMLLTLGVGQMEAKTVYVDLTYAPGWYDDAYVHTWDGSTDRYYSLATPVIADSKIYEVTFSENAGWEVCRGGSNKWNQVGWRDANSTQNVCQIWNDNNNPGTTSWTISGFYTNGGYIYYRIKTGHWDESSATMKPKFYFDETPWGEGSAITYLETIDSYKYYSFTIPNSYTSKVLLTRYNSAGDVYWAGYTAYSEAPTGNNNTIVNDATSVGENQSVSWTTYAPPLSAISISDNGTTTLAGAGTEGNPYLIATGATIEVSASGTKAVNDPNATIYYDFKDNTTSKSGFQTGKTYSFTASGTANTVYEMNVDGKTKIGSTYGTASTSGNTIYYKTVSVKDISVYIYVGGRSAAEYNSVEMNGCTPYVGTTALSAVKINNQSAGAPKFTLSGNWLVYTFENVTKVSNITCARSGGNIFSGEITDNVYYMYDGTVLPGQCIQPANPTWGTAPANGAAGGTMTASVSGAPDGATITWSSTATSYATVNSSGVISYVAAGSATIKARVQKAASGDYCALNYTLSQDITVTSGATVSATRTCPEYVSTAAGQVTLDISSTGASTGWYYRIWNGSGYEAPDNVNASSNSASWTMTGGVPTGERTYTVELYNGSNEKQATSSGVTITGEIAYNTTISAGSNGSVSPSGTIYANNNHVHPSITATPNEHYHFVNWTSSNAAAWVADANDATTTVTATAGGYTITANFAGDQYTITYKDQGNESYSGSNEGSLPTTHTYGTATALVNGTKTGYNFAGWYTDASCTSSAGSSIGATAKTADFTLYAKWTEITSSLTTSCSYNVGNPSYAIPTKSVSSIGISTTATLTATTPSTGYTFAGWTLSDNLVVTSGNKDTDLSITVRTNGNGAAAIAQANYAEDLSTGWKIMGGTLFGGSGWDTDCWLVKKTGHSTESVGYYTIYVPATNPEGSNTNYNFKVVNPGDTWFGLHTDNCAWDWLYKRDYGTQTMINHSTNNDNVQICADIAGNYEIVVDYSTPASPTVTINFPTTYTLTYSIGSVNGTSGTISTSPSTASGSKVLSGTNVTLTGPAAKSGYTWKGWYTNAAGTEGKIADTDRAITVTMNADKTLYACYTINNHAITYTAPSNGTYTIKVGDAAAVSTNTTSDYGKTITLSAERNWGYDFTEWTVTKDGGGSVTPSSSASANPATFSMPDDDVTISATFTVKSCTITLNNQDADAGKGGTGSQTTNYNTSTGLSTITCPQKTGYIFGGYYTAGNGKGSQIIARNGSWNANVATYMYDGKWVYDGGTTLYAWWIECAGYSFHYGTHDTDDWAKTCFTQDGSTSTWNIENFAIPNKPNFFVGYQEEFYASGLGTGDTKSKSVERAWTDTYSEVSSTGQGQMKLLPGGYTVGQATGALGTITIDTDSKDYNLSVGFTPNGYGVTHNSGTHEFVTASSNWRETEVVTLTSGDVSGNFQVKLKTSSSWAATAHGVAEIASAVNGRKISGDSNIANGLKGVFQMWTDAAANNFGLCFVTVHDVTFDMQGHGSAISKYSDVRYNNKISAPSAPSATGYTFGGWYKEEGCTNAWDFDNDVITAATTLYAKWTAKTYTVTLDQQSGAEGYSASGDGSLTATFDAAFPSAAMPTAANGYAFMGYWSAAGGTGTQFTDASGNLLANIDSYSDASGNWIYAGDDLTLYAYYKKAEITNLVAAPSVIAPDQTITITPTIEPTPTGTTKVCYELQYSNGTPLPSQPTFTPGIGNAVSFPVPSASATYIIQAKLAKGSTCPANPEDVLSTRTTTFQVAGAHDVTVKYMCGDLTIKASEVLEEIRPLTWSEDITAPTITGYTFARWDAGDGVTIKDGSGEDKTTSTSSTIKIKAVYDGTLTAVYNKKNMIFFNNTLGWDDVYVYFYTSDKYWDNSYGTGAYKGKEFDYNKQFWDMHYGQMTQIEGTDIWYFDYTARGWDGWANVAFANMDKANSGEDNTSDNAKAFFSNTTSDPIQVVRRGDHVTSLPMFVPLSGQTGVKRNENRAVYYDNGYWMNYPENTGYTLLIYNQKAKDGATKLYEIPFEFTEDYTMPMELKVDLEAGQTYGFEIYRADGTYFSTTTTIIANTSNWRLYKNQTSYCGLQTTAAGDYTFSLFYNGEYSVGVTYPVAVNDYRIVYTDLATWSKAAHTASWYHPSGVITKNGSATETKKDTVSFFWTYGSSPAIAYQTCSAVAAGSASWSASTSISVSSYSSVLTEKGIYNFIFEQPAGGASISLIGVEPYTGKYYIRTDCAGSTKWSNFQSTDHEMTYSDYTEKNHGYSHYYTHWVTTGQNVKFCIANDYSQCITDTLVEDIGTVIADITTEGNANAGRLNSGNASIRFMWNQATNKISRAYISGSTNISDRFLVLEGDAKMFDAEGNALSISGLNANEINLVDDQNFVYEREIKVQTGARAKLTAKYNNNVQYFRGSEGAFAEGTTVELLGGSESATKHTMRIVYDFKTNRLVTAYVPSGTIEDDIAINADLMIVREHQEAGQQLLFNDGSLSEVHTVYGVMRFNRWTLNNKNTTEPHGIVADPKSAYERGLYWISFPFDVNLSDVFGFGTYGTHWIIMEYDGAERASKGYWKDSEGFWKYVLDRSDKVLEAGKGYVLALDLDLMRYDDGSFWANNIEQVELFFPSVEEVENIESTNVTTTVDAHACTIDRTNNNGPDINKNRTRADSHWNIIGIPSYANYGTTLKDGAEGEVITWNSSPYTNDLPFLYEWSTVDNTYSVQSGTTYPFKAMHAYMVQYHGDLYWSLASATPVSPIVARRTYAEKPQNVEMRIELQQNEKAVDQTFVKLSNDENVSTNFAFDEDLCKEYNANKANIYTIVENYLPVAGNTMPMSDQTTLVPVGVKIAANGEYTFAIPEGTEGIGVVLIDNIAGTRTNLGLMDYSVTLEQGQIDNRFLLEISPVHQSPTAIELLNGENGENGVRKVLIDNILYIVKDGVMYDARGSRVQ